jgi:hypothetical protein
MKLKIQRVGIPIALLQHQKIIFWFIFVAIEIILLVAVRCFTHDCSMATCVDVGCALTIVLKTGSVSEPVR